MSSSSLHVCWVATKDSVASVSPHLSKLGSVQSAVFRYDISMTFNMASMSSHKNVVASMICERFAFTLSYIVLNS